jgi:hypothetical protein
MQFNADKFRAAFIRAQIEAARFALAIRRLQLEERRLRRCRRFSKEPARDAGRTQKHADTDNSRPA